MEIKVIEAGFPEEVISNQAESSKPKWMMHIPGRSPGVVV